jgi:hypothetical protein
VVLPEREALLRSPELAASVFEDAGPIDTSELRDIAARAGALAQAPWQLGVPTLQWGLGRGLLRYNRVEGLSVGARAALDLGVAELDLTGRIGTADRAPRGELGLSTRAGGAAVRLAGYHRLTVMEGAARAFSPGASLNALLLGRDDAEYFAATGVELHVSPGRGWTRPIVARVYAERQRAVETGTTFSARRILDGGFGFAPVVAADRADQVGGEFVARLQRWEDTGGARAGLEVGALAETGTFRFVRPHATLQLAAPLGRMLTIGAEGSAGTTFGAATAQRLWRLGGAGTLRGYDMSALSGEAFWRGRGEIGTALPLARVTLFSDIGWAGAVDAIGAGRPIRSAGVGVGFLDGLLRFDVAGPVGPRPAGVRGGWRLHAYIDGIL